MEDAEQVQRNGKKNRRDFARKYGLQENASWDEIYSRWKQDGKTDFWNDWKLVVQFVFAAVIMAAIPLLISTHWLSWILAAVVAVLVFAALFFRITMILWARSSITNPPEIIERAKCDRTIT